MKNLFLEKNIVQKLIIALVIIILFNFASPTLSNGVAFGWKEVGGALLAPILQLIMAITDATLNLLQTTLLTNMTIITPATSDELKEEGWGVLKVIGVILCVAVVVVAVVVTSGAAAGAVAAIGASIKTAGVIATVTSIATVLPAGTAGTIVGALAIGGAAGAGAVYLGKGAAKDFCGEFDLPTIVYTPFAIFSGIIPLFDINFFNPSTEFTQVVNSADLFVGVGLATVENDLEDNEVDEEGANNVCTIIDNAENKDLFNYIAVLATWGASFTYYYDWLEQNGWGESYENSDNVDDSVKETIKKWIENGVLYVSSGWEVNNYEGIDIDNDIDTNLAQIAGLTNNYHDYWLEGEILEDEVISKRKKIDITSNGYVEGYQYDMFDDNEYWSMSYDITEYVGYDHYGYCSLNLADDNITINQAMETYGIDTLKAEVKELYLYLLECCDAENEALVESVIGEQEGTTVFDTSSALVLQETVAKWYYNLRNFALVCLLIILVYIGIRIVISSTAPEKAKYKQMIMNWVVAICILFLLHIIMIVTLTITEKITASLIGACDDVIVLELPADTKVIGKNDSTKELDVEYTAEDGTKQTANALLTTNFVGYVRYYAGIYAGDEEDVISADGIGYIIIYIMLVVQTCMFTWVYGKRVVYMAFLTIIAPLIAITYPIDKIGDGKSQAFDMWLKEYIFNALLQPIHLLTYTVTCGTALNLMCQSPVYGVICLAFVVPAEKFIRKMFGFEKAQTPSALGGAAGAALAMSGIQRLGSMIRPDGKDDREADKPNKQERIRMANPEAQANLKEKAKTGKEAASGRNSSNIRTARGTETTTPTPAPADTTPTDPAPTDTTPTDTTPTDPTSTDTTSTDTTPADTTPTDTTPTDTTPAAPTSTDTTPTDPTSTDTTPAAPTSTDTTPTDTTPAAPTSTDPVPTDPAPADPTPATDTEKKDPKKFTARGKRAYENWKDYQTRRIENELLNPKKRARRRRKIRRAVLGGALGFGAGLTMAAAKMAMGENASSVITGATAGAAAGYAIGSKGAQKVQELEKMDATREAMRDGWYTQKELREQRDAEARRKAKEDPNTRAIVREAFPDNWREMLYGRKVKGRKQPEQSWFDYCYDYGLQDPEEIVAAHKYKDSDEFKEKYDKTGVSEEQKNAIALTTARDWEKYGSWITDPKKWSELETGKTNLFKQDEEVQRMSREEFELNEANQKAEYAAGIAALEEEKANDEEYNRAQAIIQEADDEETVARAQMNEEMQKAMAENYEEEGKLAQLQQQLMQAQSAAQAQLQSKNMEISNVEADFNSRISSESAILANANASKEAKEAARQRIAEMESEKADTVKRLKEEKAHMKRQETTIQNQINAIRNNQIEELREARQTQIKENYKFAQRTIKKKKEEAVKIKQRKDKEFSDKRAELKKASEAKLESYDSILTRNANAMAKAALENIQEFDGNMDNVKG